MKRLKEFLVVIAAVAAAGSVSAQVALPIAVVPVIAKVSGAAGTDWMTSLSISNISGFSVDVEARFLKENTANIPIFVPVERFALDIGETITVDDVLGTWFPNQGDTKGFLLVLAEPTDGRDEAAVVVVTGRVFNNADPSATYGQSVPSSLFHIALGSATAVMPGAQWDDAKRTNVGVVNLSLDQIDVIITVYGADGSVIVAENLRVKSFSLRQRSLEQLGVSELSPPGRVEVQIDPESITWDPCDINLEELDLSSLQGVFIAYMSRVDQVTGDAEFILGDNDWREYAEECGDIPLSGL